MNSFLFALEAVLPIVSVMVIGYILKRVGVIPCELAVLGNRLVFKLFLPVLLFLNIYKIDSIASVGFGYIVYAVCAILAIFAIGIPLVMLITKRADRRGPVLQCVFRSNFALIGIPLAISLYGDVGGAVASLLSAFAIPLFNVLAVISLSVFGEGERPSAKKILLGILKNPLIWGVASGCLTLAIRAVFVNLGLQFRLSDIDFIYDALSSLAGVATPLALLMLGAQFEFSAIPNMKREIIFAVAARVLIVPLTVILIALFFPFEAYHFAVFIALFATPVAVSSVPMAQEAGADSALAGQLVVWTTILSVFTLFGFIFAFSALGIL